MTNADGRRAVLSPTHRHYYCSARVPDIRYWSNCRSSCDGQCGPSNGCNCRACHALDIATGLGGYNSEHRANGEGAAVSLFHGRW